MRIFLITDNFWWFNKLISLFEGFQSCYEVTFFCSKSSVHLFKEEIGNQNINVIDI